MNTLEQFQTALSGGRDGLEPLPNGVWRLPIGFANAYFVETGDGEWVLVDTGLPSFAGRVLEAARERFGPRSKPVAIILTHGHFDHAGSAWEVAEEWDVPIYAHQQELPYLTGLSDYPPQDPTIGGAISFLSRFFPHKGYDFTGRVSALPDDFSVPGMPGWRWIHTPGHTPGHVSIFHEDSGFLLAGDAVTTMDLDSWAAQVSYRKELDRPPAPFTPDWNAARTSVETLATLKPSVIAAGHGIPIRENDPAQQLSAFAGHFPIPTRGRYVARPAKTDASGVVALPPKPSDPFPKQLAVGIAAATVAALVTSRMRR